MPQWAQLTRLAGDRAAILFEDLRRRVGKIAGLQEELHYFGPEQAWAPRYRIGEETLFIVRVRPGLLEAAVPLDESLRQKLLASPKLGAEIKEAIRNVSVQDPDTGIKLKLSNPATVRALVNLVLMKSKLLATAPSGAKPGRTAGRPVAKSPSLLS